LFSNSNASIGLFSLLYVQAVFTVKLTRSQTSSQQGEHVTHTQESRRQPIKLNHP